MRRTFSVVFPSIATLIAAAGIAFASGQDPAPVNPASDLAPPLYTAAVEGNATLTRDGATSSLELNVPVVDGDRLRTGTGRVELADPALGSLFLDQETTVDVTSTGRLRLSEGRLRLVVSDAARTELYVDTPGATILPSEAGDYLIEVTAGPRQTVTLSVIGGGAELAADRGNLVVRAGETATVRGMGDAALASGSPPWDDFDRWVRARLDQQRAQAQSDTGSYLPDDLRAFQGTLDRHGSWGYEQDYGYVWYPTVAVAWQPYSAGRWDRVGRYGWFWVGVDRWSWPTHHYGRWGHRGSRWFWIPERHWAPAWVHWGVGPGYVGWCPLGVDNAPVFAFGAHVTGGTTYARGRGTGASDPWRGWNLVTSDHFHSRQPVTRGRIDGRTLTSDITSAFVTQRAAPPGVSGGVAVPRAYTGSTFTRGGVTRIENPPLVPGGAVAVPRGPDTSPYDRARQYMDPRNTGVPGARSRVPAGRTGPADPPEVPGTGDDAPGYAVPTGRHVPPETTLPDNRPPRRFSTEPPPAPDGGGAPTWQARPRERSTVPPPPPSSTAEGRHTSGGDAPSGGRLKSGGRETGPGATNRVPPSRPRPQ